MADVQVHCAHDAMVPLSELKLNPNNRNKHPAEQIERLAKIMKYNGVRRPVIVSKLSGMVTVGHGRIMAMKKLGMTHAPVNFQDYADTDAEYADAVADNAVALWAELDLAGINSDVGDLGPDFDLGMLGIKDFTLDVVDSIDLPEILDKDMPQIGQLAFQVTEKQREMINDALANVISKEELDLLDNNNKNSAALYILAMRYMHED